MLELRDKIKKKIEELINNNYILEAKQLLKEYSKIGLEEPSYYSFMGIINLIEGEIELAIKQFEIGLTFDSQDFDINYNLGILYQDKEEYFKSIIYFKRALFQLDEGEERDTLQALIDRIEYKDYNENAIIQMRIYKNQVKEYAKQQILNPDIDLCPTDYIKAKNPIEKEQIKIIYASIEIANQMNTYASEFKKMGYQAYSLNYYPTYLKYDVDFFYDINEIDYDYLGFVDKVSYIISEFDVFHFFFNSTLFPGYLDLKIIKNLEKKMVMHNWGSDVRSSYEIAKKMSKYYELQEIREQYFDFLNKEEMKEDLYKISNYIDVGLVFQLDEFVKDYYKKIYQVNLAIDIQKYRYVENVNNDKLKIVHAPTNKVFKGTKYIIEAVKKLHQKYDFEFILISGMKHEEAKKIYEEADLIVDQIIAGGPGLFAHECMTMGKNVMCYISDYFYDEYNHYYNQNNSLISANPDNIYEKLEDFILNRNKYNKTGFMGRKFVENNNDSHKVCLNLLEIYKGL